MKKKNNGFFTSFKNASMISSLIYIILGAVLILKPGSSLILLCRMIGWAGLIMGLTGIFFGLCNRSEEGRGGYGVMGGSIALALLGLFLIANPEALARLVPTIIGLVILLNGLWNLLQTWWLRSVRVSRNGSLVMALGTLILGILILAHPFGVGSALVMLTGVILVYNGLTNIWVLTRFESDMRNPRSY